MAIRSPLSRLQLKDEAATYIRELIASGQVFPGQLLRLSPLAEKLGASVTPVREALLLLAQDGWVVQEPNRGFRVARVSREDVADVYFVQALVAGELAARAAVVISDEEVFALREIDEHMRGHTGGDAGYLESGNTNLHDLVYSIGESPRLTWFVRAASRFVPRRFWAIVPGWIEHNHSGHTPIIDALEGRDPDTARLLMSAHIDNAGQLLLAHLDSVGFWDAAQADAS
jgi:DNA-binding GntR family transcriptional regulator